MPASLRRALRSLARRRTFAVTAVLTLALAFSIPAVVLSTLDRHFWRPLDLPGSDRLFTLTIRAEDGYFSPLSHPEYLQLREVGAETEAFSLAAFGSLDVTVVVGGGPARLEATLVSGGFFTLLEAEPARGRLLAPSDDDPGGAPVAVVSHRAWTTRFGRDPDLVGRTVRLGPQAFRLSVSVEIPGTPLQVLGNAVSADYFRTLGVAVLEGREFTAADHADSALVAIVNRTLAERLWPGRPAVGQVLTFPLSGGDRTVIGVVDDVRYHALTEATRPLAYLPLAQRFFPRAFLHARSGADTGPTLGHVRRVLADLDPGVPLSGAGTLRDRVDEALARWRAPALLTGLLALVTLVLTMGGLYAVLTMAVGQRTRELAIRVALGAREVSLRRMVLAEGLRLVAAGALMGLVAAVPLTRLLESQLYGVAPHDAATLAAGLIGLLAAGALASDLPARRAARLDPAAALRSE